MEEPFEQKPRLEKAGEDFSVLNTVEYKGRYLYSRHAPKKAIEAVIERTPLLSGTLIIICSPVLWYGFDKLKEKLPKGCAVMALEEDRNLFELASHALPEGVVFFDLGDAAKIDAYVRALCKTGMIKRSVRLDFSSAVYFAKEKYDCITYALNNIIVTFWKNRVTLIKFSRLYSKNFLRNLAGLEKHPMLDDVAKSVARPILVLAAGESLDSLSLTCGTAAPFYIIAVDAALRPLLARGIVPDACVSMESQAVIKRAFIGAKKLGTVFFLDLCSCPDIATSVGSNIVYFATRYADAAFFDRLLQEKIIRSYIDPMGSVGLAALYIALILRKSEDVYIFAGGLDFSFSIGRTHAKGTMQEDERLIEANRVHPANAVAAAFSVASSKAAAQDGREVITTKALSDYATQVRQMFSEIKNLYDCAGYGLPIGLTKKSLDAVSETTDAVHMTTDILNTRAKGAPGTSPKVFLTKERESLSMLKDLLSNGDKSRFRDKSESLDYQIKQLLEGREYLYMHFPDGFSPRYDESFLKRVRAELDFFIKQLNIALS